MAKDNSKREQSSKKLPSEGEKKGKKKRKEFRGIVISDRMDKTRVVEVTRIKIHPIYKKRFKVSRRFKAHDEKNEYRKGDKVVICEVRPLSKEKRWEILSKL
ncbi:30S ribosomal protein S17 [bacterium (Candidatus Torokbacteria) CG_4_10_14_0_2_um_filter_35_8]|nr:MAG: 30S ribosomal protein S17 [bacterium (Candidatus Torokbacteria) CG_4_10_14_0_2_um_filter_35_8]